MGERKPSPTGRRPSRAVRRNSRRGRRSPKKRRDWRRSECSRPKRRSRPSKNENEPPKKPRRRSRKLRNAWQNRTRPRTRLARARSRTTENSSRPGLGRLRSGPKKPKVCEHPLRRPAKPWSAAKSNSKPRSLARRRPSSRRRIDPATARKTSTSRGKRSEERRVGKKWRERKRTLRDDSIRIRKRRSTANSPRHEV